MGTPTVPEENSNGSLGAVAGGLGLDWPTFHSPGLRRCWVVLLGCQASWLHDRPGGFLSEDHQIPERFPIGSIGS